MKVTIVFEKNLNAINEPCPNCDNDHNDKCTWCAGSNHKYKYIINRGSSRSSKTISLIQVADLYCRSNNHKRWTIWRDTKSDCKKTVLADMLKLLKREKIYKHNQTFHKTESIFTYNTDSTVEIHGTDDEETVHGLSQDCAHFNEPYKISRETFDQIDQRTSDFVFIDYNPKKGHWVEDLMKDKRAIIIDSTFKDNPFCPPEQRRKILSYQPLSFCDAVTSGDISLDVARKYDTVINEVSLSEKQLKELLRCQENEDKNTANEFNWQVYGLGTKAEKPNRIFKWKEIPYQDYQKLECPVYIGVDWGKVDPFAIVEAKYLDGCLYLHELNYLSENEIRQKLTETERRIVGSDMSDEVAQESGIVTFMFEKLAISKDCPIVCDTNRPLKIAALRRKGYNAFGANKAKGSITDGIGLLDNLNVYYTSCSENLKYEQENYSYKIDRYGVVLEEPEDAQNHQIDSSRYIALYLQIKGFIKLV